MDLHGTVVGAEALIRWIGADGKVISPAEFIPLAEDTGLIVPMGQWVLDTACRQLARWQRSPATRHLTLAINVSARQFHQADFAAQLRSALERHHLDASGLKLELTESAILGDIDTTIERMHQLRELGIRFALDDFGTGYSSLSYLKRLPFDQLKIDQSFIHDMLIDNTSNAIVRAVLVMDCQAKDRLLCAGMHRIIKRHAHRLARGKNLPLAAVAVGQCDAVDLHATGAPAMAFLRRGQLCRAGFGLRLVRDVADVGHRDIQR